MIDRLDPNAAPMLHPPAPDGTCLVIGVGASAGGLEAFTQLLQAFPTTTGTALVLISHLDPDHPSFLADLLAKVTTLPIQLAGDTMPVEPNHIYVLPPNTTLRLVGRSLRLTPRPESAHPHLPIDSFFQSLADTQGTAAIGVVLSGTGSDGTIGLGAIKAAGGMTLAQEPTSAAFPQLPQSAIVAGCVDLVLPPAELATAIARLSQSSRTALANEGDPEPAGSDDSLLPLFALVQTATGIDFSAYKRSTIVRRLQRRMALRQHVQLDSYLDYLRDQPDEVQALAQDFLICVTEFFRDPEAFTQLQQLVLQPMLQQRPLHTPLRIWVIGCATGQEAYSLAMLLIETAEAVRSAVPLQIFATDLNTQALAAARNGFYSEASVQSLSPARRERFLTPIEQGYRVKTSLRERCIFAHHNLVSDPPFSNLDLICCRNLLIYLGLPLQQHVIPLLHYALKPGGVLMLGAAEQLTAFGDLFSPLDTPQRLYRRVGSTRTLTLATLSGGSGRPIEFQLGATRADQGKMRAMQQTAHQLMATNYAQPGVLITSGYDILHIYGHTGRYLELAPGETSMNLLRMAQDGLLAAIQRAVTQAVTEQTVVRAERVQLLTLDAPHSVTLEVTPIRDPRSDELLFLVVFLEPPAAAPPSKRVRRTEEAEAVHTQAWREEMEALRGELSASKAYLRTIIAEQSATNDELKLLNEELLSRNEEVQSFNEELQTAKEEVQSTNEELTTVNEELQQRNRELSLVNSDLHRLLTSINIPIVMLDQAGSICRFTPLAARMLELRAGDIGRPLREVAARIAVPALEAVVAQVQQSGQLAEFPLEHQGGLFFLLRIWPTRDLDGVIDGVVLVWIDVAALRQAEAAQRLLDRSLLEQQKLESLGMLAGGVAHDFNNLLAIILGNTQLALLDLEPAAPAYISLLQIEATSQRAIDLTRQMLNYAGKGQRQLEVVDLNELIESTAGLLQASIGSQLTLHYDLSSTPLLVVADSTQIHQVLMNLVRNAAEASGPTNPLITIRSDLRRLEASALGAFQVGGSAAGGASTGQEYVLLEVEDTGLGMDEATQTRIFEPFFSTKFTGRGLGLAAVQGIVQAHAGAIQVRSRPGSGTTITVVFPRANEDAVLTPVIPASRPTIAQSLIGGTVLVIDDEDAVREVTARLLKRLGFASLTAADGAAGIALFQQHVATVTGILLDVTMPGLTTSQVIAGLRAIRADVPIMLMSGYPRETVQELPQTNGFLHKPFTFEELQDILGNQESNEDSMIRDL